jgi:dihydroorotase (multifunctional complex type)
MVAIGTGQRLADVGIRGGRIAAVGDAGTLNAESLVDARGRLVLPGVVDIHVHFREPGLTHKEDFNSGSAAAACGGVTYVCDMPNTEPPVIDTVAFVQKAALAAGRMWVDYGLWAGGTRIEEFAGMAAAGAAGLKVYMVAGANDPDPLYVGDDSSLLATLQESARVGWPVSVHVGDELLLRAERRALVEAGAHDPRAYLQLSRGESSRAGLRKVLEFSRTAGAGLNIAHVSVFGPAALEVIKDFRRRGGQVKVESPLPALGEEELDRLGIYALPYALPAEELEYFWEAIRSGTIDFIATDHAPHTREEKEPGRIDIWSAPPGFPAVETSLALAIDAVLTQKLSLSRLTQAMAEAPAAWLGLKKGAVAVGFDADLVLVNPDGENVLSGSRLHSKVGWTPFEGRRLRGSIESTYVRGKLIAHGGEIVADQPSGMMAPLQGAQPGSGRLGLGKRGSGDSSILC